MTFLDLIIISYVDQTHGILLCVVLLDSDGDFVYVSNGIGCRFLAQDLFAIIIRIMPFMSQVLPGLFIGSRLGMSHTHLGSITVDLSSPATMSQDALLSSGITHVLSVCSAGPCKKFVSANHVQPHLLAGRDVQGD